MIVVPSMFPFSKLKLGEGEVLKWVGSNPTFHRFRTYGLAISDVAFYMCSGAWIFARWQRYALADISTVSLNGIAYGVPRIEFWVAGKKVTFRTPYDSHDEEVEFDRGVLLKATELMQLQCRINIAH
jgi:hypothetical protein